MTRFVRPILLLSVSALTLAACEVKTPPPAIAYDSAAFKPAVAEPEPSKPVEIVPLPEPLPLPGQLKPPSFPTSEGSRQGSQALARGERQRNNVRC